MNDQQPSAEPYWTIHQSTLREMLERAAAGESPDMIIAEKYANAREGGQR